MRFSFSFFFALLASRRDFSICLLRLLDVNAPFFSLSFSHNITTQKDEEKKSFARPPGSFLSEWANKKLYQFFFSFSSFLRQTKKNERIIVVVVDHSSKFFMLHESTKTSSMIISFVHISIYFLIGNKKRKRKQINKKMSATAGYE
jgi:hypothetical protein